MPFSKIHSTLPCKNFPLTVRPSESGFLISCVLPFLCRQKLEVWEGLHGTYGQKNSSRGHPTFKTDHGLGQVMSESDSLKGRRGHRTVHLI